MPISHVRMLYSYLQHHNDTIIKQTHEVIKMQEGRRKKTSLTTYLPLNLLQGSKGLFTVCM